MIERINDFAASHFGGVGTTRGSLVRVHAWVIAFLLLASAVASSHGASLASRRRLGPVEDLVLGFDNQRSFSTSAFGKNYFHVAWIMGSEGDVYTKGPPLQFVARKVFPLLPKIDGRTVAIDLYALPAMRIADEYFVLLDALAEKPDMIVMSLNPVWSLNPLAIHQWMQLDPNAATALATKPEVWPLGASLLSPSDLAWGLAGNLEPFANRTYYSQKIHDLVDDLGPLDRTKLARLNHLASLKPDRYTAALADTPLGFWFKHRYNEAPVNPYAANTHGMTPQRWAQWMNHSNTMDNAIDRRFLRAIGDALKGAKVPSFVYLAQINSDWLKSDKDVRAATEGVEAQLEAQRSAFQAPNIVYQPKTASRFTTGLHFLVGDPVHMDQPGSMPLYLAQQLCLTLAQAGDISPCKPLMNRSGHG